jgi:hypothetical protein
MGKCGHSRAIVLFIVLSRGWSYRILVYPCDHFVAREVSALRHSSDHLWSCGRHSLEGHFASTMPYEDTNIPNSTATKCQMKQHGKCSGKWHGFPWVSVFVAERVHLRILCQLHRWPVSLALKFHRWIWSMYRWISSIYMRTTMEFRSNKDWIQIYFYF